MNAKRQGFTIVELLIVVVIIAILARIVIASFSGIKQRALEAAVKSDFRSNALKVNTFLITNGSVPTYAQTQSNADASIKLSPAIYKNATYCANDTDGAAFGAELTSGDKYYQQVGQQLVKDNTVDIMAICSKLSIVNSDGSAATAGYIVSATLVWTFCANENATCSFTGTKTVRYGANTTFITKTGVVSSIACNNTAFGSDPTPGVAKKCEYQ